MTEPGRGYHLNFLLACHSASKTSVKIKIQSSIVNLEFTNALEAIILHLPWHSDLRYRKRHKYFIFF